LTSIAGGVERIGDELATAEKILRRLAYVTEDTFGEYGGVQAWRELFDPWTGELRVASRASHEWSEAVYTAVGNYRRGDMDAAPRFGER
jgi:hypothetical protein